MLKKKKEREIYYFYNFSFCSLGTKHFSKNKKSFYMWPNTYVQETVLKSKFLSCLEDGRTETYCLPFKFKACKLADYPLLKDHLR